MSSTTIILTSVLAALFVWYVIIIFRRNALQEAFSSIDVQLKQRLDLIPNILKIAQKMMVHERELLEEVTRLRTLCANASDQSEEGIAEKLAASNVLSSRMGQLMVQVENYPDLKSDQTMIQAMQTYNEVEAKIAASRRFYNSSVTALNNVTQIPPGQILAVLAGVKSMPYFEAEEAARSAIDADSYLGR